MNAILLQVGNNYHYTTIKVSELQKQLGEK